MPPSVDLPEDFIRNEFPQSPDLLYLNHAAVAPWPARTAKAVQDFARENLIHGARHYPQWLKTEQNLRTLARELVGARSVREIAFAKNTSEALSQVALGLDWCPGDEILVSSEEFPSNRIVWEAAAERFDLSLRPVDLTKASDPTAALIEAVSNRTRLVAVSSVQYGSGRRIDPARLGPALHSRQVLFCLDAIQSVGASPVAAEDWKVDFLMADGHKWMLGPEGLAIFYIRQERQNQIRLNQYGWHMVQHRGQYDRKEWQVADDATRFECGSPNMVGIYALAASLSLLLEVGLPSVESAILKRIRHLATELRSIPGVEIVTPLEKGQYLGILTFHHPDVDSGAWHKALMERGVICAHRGGGVRFSPHFYTPYPILDEAVKHVRQTLSSLSA